MCSVLRLGTESMWPPWGLQSDEGRALPEAGLESCTHTGQWEPRQTGAVQGPLWLNLGERVLRGLSGGGEGREPGGSG